MLNNALMTIEALAELENVSEISVNTLKDLYNRFQLGDLNKRLKNYTMLFTKNGPLHNDKSYGDRIYETLLNEILDHVEVEGKNICEISGLCFNTSFEYLFRSSLMKIGLSETEINKKDTGLSRMWFPLIGGLGSDAQALPQAKFTINIHPICIVILQFLPLSSLLYKGGILLIDSSNFDLAKRMIMGNAKILSEKIQTTSSKDAVENVKDFSKGDYLLKILDILLEKEEMEESYSDLNMWSFSNSGTGASCEIDRVPNMLIKKLMYLAEKPQISSELKSILSNSKSSASFLVSLEDNIDWFLLYPNVFGSGKKKIEYEGVTPLFLEAYYEVIQDPKSIVYAKYIAGLIKKYKSKEFEKLLLKTDAWSEPEFRVETYKVVVKAAENGEWDLLHQTQILDENGQTPIKNYFYKLHRLIYFYYNREIFENRIPLVENGSNRTYETCKQVIGLIQKDSKSATIISQLINPHEYSKVGYFRVYNDAQEESELKFKSIVEVLFNDELLYFKFGLNELLRLFFSQSQKPDFSNSFWENSYESEHFIDQWISSIDQFATDYCDYYCAKYANRETGKLPTEKFSGLINRLISEQNGFIILLKEAIYNTNQYLSVKEALNTDKWDIADLLTDPLGKHNTTFCIPAIKFALKKKSIALKNQTEIITN